MGSCRGNTGYYTTHPALSGHYRYRVAVVVHRIINITVCDEEKMKNTVQKLLALKENEDTFKINAFAFKIAQVLLVDLHSQCEIAQKDSKYFSDFGVFRLVHFPLIKASLIGYN